jgi:hypothetical protein
VSTRVLIVVTNVGHYEVDPSHPTGLWLSELTHAWDVFEQRGFEHTVGPDGIDPDGYDAIYFTGGPHHHGILEPGRDPTADLWHIRLRDDGTPEILPPIRVDPRQRPRLHARFRTRAQPRAARSLARGGVGRVQPWPPVATVPSSGPGDVPCSRQPALVRVRLGPTDRASGGHGERHDPA